MLGLELMPWQEYVAMVGGELNDDGLPAYREVVFTVPRQSGKSSTQAAWIEQRARGWGEVLGPQRLIYSAQTGKDARDKLLNDWFPVMTRNRLELGITRLLRGSGQEEVHWSNGSLLSLLASMEESGHGKTIDLPVLDELFADSDHRRLQSMIPAMATRDHAQMLIASTAGTADSVAWNEKVAQGRAAVEAGRTSGVAYFEWSARLDDDPLDPATWWACMPALGRTIRLPAVEHALATMELGEFMRAWLNVPTTAEDAVIPALTWDLVQSNTLRARPAACMALDCPPERDAGAIVAAGNRTDRPVLEVVDYRPGTGWLVDRARQLWDTYQVPFVLDGSGPAASYAEELEREGITVIRVAPRDLVSACGRFYDRVINENVWIRKHSQLDLAVAGAVKRPSGDAWAWGRKGSRVDISLLVAATLSLWMVDSVPKPSTKPVFAY